MKAFKPKTPPPPVMPEPPPPPVREDATAAAENEADAFRRRKGRASTILSDQTGGGKLGNAQPQTATKQLLGS